ncbi:T9SS type A sorting domain-containing protein [candidate division KSB1 bacterium]|nr:T9SS type A sorting domain-containing protein [candidate division KSB1 bacterium]
MLHANKSQTILWTGLLLILLSLTNVAGQTINTLDRPYNYLVIKGSDVSEWLDQPFNTIQPRFYKYDVVAGTWAPIPYQFDNWNLVEDPQLISAEDEFLFMTSDMGDQAPPDAWVNDDEAKMVNRIEIHASDPLIIGEEGWIYLYQSSTLPLSNTKYVHYTSSTDEVESDVYLAGHGNSGFQGTLKIKTDAGGDNLDFLDRQKFRLHLHASAFGLDSDILFKEEMHETITLETGVTAEIEVRKQSVNVTGDGTIRIFRNLQLYGKLKIKVGGIELYDLDGNFVFPTVYYPHFSEWQTPEIPIEPSSDYQIRGIRLSVDLNNNAKGMQFYNPYNTAGSLIDGEMDDLNLSLNWPGQNWHMIVADPSNPISSLNTATLLNVFNVTGEPIGDVQALHYVDNSDFNPSDTGDHRAIGDTGVRVTGNNIIGEFSVNMALFYLADNLTMGDAQIVSDQYNSPPEMEMTEQQPPYQLTVLLNPADGGQVTMDPDQDEYAAGTSVQLTAEANSGFDFDHWSGDTKGSVNPIDIVMDTSKTVTAHFVTLRQITIQADPSNIKISVDGVEYPSPTTFGWLDGETHTICVDSTIGVNFGARFAFQSWSDSGALCHDYVVPHQDDTLTAQFITEHQLIADINPEDAGEILVTPETEDFWFINGTEISVHALPAYAFVFDHWTGALTGETNPTQLTMYNFKRITAHFVPDTQQVTIQTNPDTLPFLVDGIEYVGSESFLWEVGSSHDLCVDSLEDAGWSTRQAFTDWNHDSTRCHSFTVPDEDIALTANFRDQYYLTTSAEPDTAGEIQVTPNGEYWYNAGTSVELEAIPAFGFAFMNWMDSLSGNENPVLLEMDNPKIVTALFGNQPPVVTASDTSFAEDDTLRIGFSLLMDWIWDENNPDSSLQVSVTGGLKIGARLDSVSEELLLYALTPNWNGTDTVTLSAKDPLSQTGSDAMSVTITSRPDAPLPFALLEPPDQSVYSEWPDMIYFSWENALDPDVGDTLTYVMEIDTTDQFNSSRNMMISGIRGNAYPLIWPSSWGDHAYFWRVTAVDEDSLTVLCSNGPFQFALATGVNDPESESLPKTVVLDQNYPNPFNGETFIRYGLPKDSNVRLYVYNMFGQRVKILVDGNQSGGYHTVRWNGIDENGNRVASGIYLIRLETPTFRSVKKIILTQ